MPLTPTLNSRSKIVKIEALKRRLAVLRRQGRTIAFTNGCFDILHYGHVSYLERAKGRGKRILVLGLNSDASVRRLKGPDRPVNNEMMRAAVAAALACVDYVCLFEEDTPYNLIQAVQPDVLIKGADWKGKEVVGSDIVRGRGGRVELIEYIPEFSTTKIIASIKKKCARHG